jgi:segregation and condensation protein A
MTDEPLEGALPPIAIPAFSGPFDLLLHLIRVNEVSITDIPIAEITEQYTAYLDAMRELDLDVASEYVAMAAELI